VKSTEIQPFNLRIRELRRELLFSLAGGHARRALTEGSYTHFVISGIIEIGKEELRASTRELARWRVATSAFGNRPWS
jgi:hypothetical protein